jgi:hypothetical protein
MKKKEIQFDTKGLSKGKRKKSKLGILLLSREREGEQINFDSAIMVYFKAVVEHFCLQ